MKEEVLTRNACSRKERLFKIVLFSTVVKNGRGRRPLTKGECSSDGTISHSSGEQDVCQLREGVRQDEEQQRGHDKPQTVHGQIMVNSVQEEVQRQRPRCIREVIVNMEQEPMESILQDSPHQVTKEETHHGLGKSSKRDVSGQNNVERSSRVEREWRKALRTIGVLHE